MWKHTLMSTYELASSLTPRQLQDTTTLGPTSEAIHEPSHPDCTARFCSRAARIREDAVEFYNGQRSAQRNTQIGIR